MRRKAAKADLGEAISFDSVLTVLTVLLVLRMIFLIPMVNVDKAKLDQARRDSLWIRVADRLAALPGEPDTAAAPYASAFELEGSRVLFERRAGGLDLVSACGADSTLLFVEHDSRSGRFASMRIQRSSEHPVFHRGALVWSPSERSWFVTSDTADYGQDPSSAALLSRVRAREESR